MIDKRIDVFLAHYHHHSPPDKYPPMSYPWSERDSRVAAIDKELDIINEWLEHDTKLEAKLMKRQRNLYFRQLRGRSFLEISHTMNVAVLRFARIAAQSEAGLKELDDLVERTKAAQNLWLRHYGWFKKEPYKGQVDDEGDDIVFADAFEERRCSGKELEDDEHTLNMAQMILSSEMAFQGIASHTRKTREEHTLAGKQLLEGLEAKPLAPKVSKPATDLPTPQDPTSSSANKDLQP